MSTITLNIELLDRHYKFALDPEQEGALRRAVAHINTEAKHYREHYKGREDIEYLSMALMSFLAQQENGSAGYEQAQVAEKLQRIEQLLQG